MCLQDFVKKWIAQVCPENPPGFWNRFKCIRTVEQLKLLKLDRNLALCMAMNLIALLYGLRISDIGTVYVTKALDQLYLTLVNWKLSNHDLKETVVTVDTWIG